MTQVESPPSNWNLPNALTTLRIVMVPFFGWALLMDGGDSILWRCVAFGLFVAAMITDKIDGDIARSRNLVTNFGKIADPIADKAITGMAFIGLSIVGDIWWSPCPASCCRSRTARTPTTATSTSSESWARCSSTSARWRSSARSR
jgi:phosphatidylglycerophosphate synthase